MTGRSEDEAGHVVAACDFGGLGRLVDVGGDHGILLGAILRSARTCEPCWSTSRR